MSADASREDTWVCVQLSDCGAEDARTVFTALGTAFGGTGEAAGLGASPPDKAQVWTSHFDTARHGEGAGSARLRRPVAVELQGSPCSVTTLKRALTSTFDGATSGWPRETRKSRCGCG